MKKKLTEWGRRYIPAEIVSIIAALVLSNITFLATHNRIATAFVGTWADNLGYYSFISAREVIQSRKKHKKEKKIYSFISFLKNIRNILLEFGFAEMFDSFIIRPAFMYFFPLLLSNMSAGIFVAIILANMIFYITTIIAYELKKKYVKD